MLIYLFAEYLCFSINALIKSSTFPCLKVADITLIHKKGKKDVKENYRPVSNLPGVFFQKYLKEVRLYKCLIILKSILRNNTVDFVKAIIPGNVC